MVADRREKERGAWTTAVMRGERKKKRSVAAMDGWMYRERERERELRGGSDSYRVVYSRPGCKENLHTPLTETSGPFHSAQAHH
jgi:hypothetical protein